MTASIFEFLILKVRMEVWSNYLYQSLEVVIADSPQDLVKELKKISVGIKIIQIVQVGTRSAAYIIDDTKVKKEEKNGAKRSSSS